MTARIDDFVLAQAKARVVAGYGLRAMAANKQGQEAEYVLAAIYEEIRTAEEYAQEIVKGLDAVPFIESYLTAEVTHTACNVPPEQVESSMKMREGFAAVLRQLNDKRALAKYGAEAVFDDVRAQYFPTTEKPK